MAGSLSNYLEAALLNLVLNNVSYSGTAVCAALFTGAGPGEDNSGTANEVSGPYSTTKYSRKTLSGGGGVSTFSFLDASTTYKNDSDIQWDIATADWGTITYVALYDAFTSGTGNLLWYGQLERSFECPTGQQFLIPAGHLRVTLK